MEIEPTKAAAASFERLAKWSMRASYALIAYVTASACAQRYGGFALPGTAEAIIAFGTSSSLLAVTGAAEQYMEHAERRRMARAEAARRDASAGLAHDRAHRRAQAQARDRAGHQPASVRLVTPEMARDMTARTLAAAGDARLTRQEAEGHGRRAQ